METAREAAPEIDRLVLSVNGKMLRTHGDRLRELAQERSLETLEMLPHFGDFLLAGRLTGELATLRGRYFPPDQVFARLDELETKGLVARDGSALVATPSFRPVLQTLQAAQGEVAAEGWGDHDDDVAAVTSLARQLAEAATDDHVVAVEHRSLPEPSDPYLRLHTRLVTLRYIRQHDHAAAWTSQGLTAPDIVTMTRLWHDEPVDPSDEGLLRLIDRGWAEKDPGRLTTAGVEVREVIEDETNNRAQQTFDALDREAAVALVAALRRLPGEVD